MQAHSRLRKCSIMDPSPRHPGGRDMRNICLGILLLAGMSAAGTIKVEGGLVEGISEDGLTVYRGIPFAAPPVGDLRWRAPQPPAKWDGVKRADKFAPECTQGGGRGA